MASSYGAMKTIERSQLLSRLVTHITGCEAPDENFGIALEYCAYHLRFHKFIDTTPQEVRRLYTGLWEKFRVHGQLEKCRAAQTLAALSLQLVEKNFPEADVEDRPARILHLLYACSNQPLQTPFLKDHVESVQNHAQKLLRYNPDDNVDVGDGAESDETEFGDLGGGDWEDDSDEEAVTLDSPSKFQHSAGGQSQHRPEDVPPPAILPARQQDGDNLFEWRKLAVLGQDGKNRGWIEEKVPEWRVPVPAGERAGREAHVNRWGGGEAAGWGEVSSGGLFPCRRGPAVMEAGLCRAALLALQGVGSAAFLLTADGSSFEAASSLHLTHLSPLALKSVLRRIERGASQAQRVRSFVDSALRPTAFGSQSTTAYNQGRQGGSQKLDTLAAAGPTIQALAQSFSSELEAVMVDVRALEAKLCSKGAGEVSLLGVVVILAPALQQLGVLAQLLSTTLPPEMEVGAGSSGGGGGGVGPHVAAGLASSVLGGLWACLEGSELASGEAGPLARCGGGVHLTCLRLWRGTLRPYLKAIDAWIHEGILKDPTGELLLHRNPAEPNMDVESPSFWDSAFTLRESPQEKPNTKSISDSAIVCPSFLRSVARQILCTGKSLQLLHHRPVNLRPCSANRTGILPPSSHHPASHMQKAIAPRSSLYETFCDRMTSMVQWSPPAQPSLVTPVSGLSVPTSTPVLNPTLEDQSRNLLISRESSNKTVLGHRGHELTVPSEKLGKSLDEEAEFQRWQVLTGMEAEGAGRGPRWGGYSHIQEETRALPPGALLTGTIRAVGRDSRQVLKNILPEGTEVEPYQEHNSHALLDLKKKTHNPLDGFSMAHLLEISDSNNYNVELLSVGSVPTLPPMSVVLEQCLLCPIRSQSARVGGELMCALRGRWGLHRELETLREVFLQGPANALTLFSEGVFHRLSRGDPCADTLELTLLLEESLTSANFPSPDHVPAQGTLAVITGGCSVSSSRRTVPSALLQHPSTSSSTTPLATSPTSGGDHLGWDLVESGERTRDSLQPAASSSDSRVPGSAAIPVEVDIHALKTLKIEYQIPWPLQMVVDSGAVAGYGTLLSFLLALRRARRAVDHTPRQHTASRPSSTLHMQLVHFLANLQQYCLDGILVSARSDLEQGIASATTLDQVRDKHRSFLRDAQATCFLSPTPLARALQTRIYRILGLALEYRHACRALDGKAATEEFNRIAADFHTSHTFLLRVLTSQLRVTHQQHLKHLLMRLNYNEYYFAGGDECMAVTAALVTMNR